MTLTRKDVPREDCWDLRALYPDDDAWEQEFARYAHGAPPLFSAISEYRDSLSDPALLKQTLDRYFETERGLRKLYTYAHLRHDEDTVEELAKKRRDRILMLMHQFGEECAWLEPAILAMGAEQHERLHRDPTLASYRFFLEKLARLQPHTLNEREERLLAMAEQPLQTSQRAFSAVNNADFRFGQIADGQGRMRELTHATYGLYLRDQDRELRKQAFFTMHRKYAEYENVLTELLSGQVQRHLFCAKARDYRSSLEAALYPKNIDREVYHTLIEAVHEHIDVLHRYMKLRKRLLSYETLHPYDLYVPLVATHDRHFSYGEAEALVIESVRPLGAAYTDRLRRGLVEERWVDRYENKNKRSGAYSSGCFDSNPYILMNFKGILRDVFTLAHEVGHSMHSACSRTHQPYQYADYPIFLAEVASTFNEGLLMDLLLERATSREEKAFLINEKIEDIRTTFFRQTMFAEFELFCHEQIEAKKPLTPGILKEEFARLNRFYFGPEVTLDVEIAIEWARIPHFYYDFYVYQYATGLSAALALVERVRSGGDEARLAYLDFLRAGGSDYPLELLRAAGVDMRSKAPIRATIDRFRSSLDQLEALVYTASS